MRSMLSMILATVLGVCPAMGQEPSHSPAPPVPAPDQPLRGIRLKNIRVGDRELTEAAVEQGVLTGRFSRGKYAGVHDLQGAELEGVRGDGRSVRLRIESVAQDSAPPHLIAYRVQYFRESIAAWEEVCGAGANGEPGTAYFLDGIWDEQGAFRESLELFTVACKGSALAKCEGWGYVPWESINGVSLREYHSTCVRMVRADYLGDGQAHTRKGMSIFFMDSLGINSGLPPEGMKFEAGWNPDGAVVVSHPRVTALAPDPLPAAKTAPVLIINFSADENAQPSSSVP